MHQSWVARGVTERDAVSTHAPTSVEREARPAGAAALVVEDSQAAARIEAAD